MAGLVPAIHTHNCETALMDGRHKGGHDVGDDSKIKPVEA